MCLSYFYSNIKNQNQSINIIYFSVIHITGCSPPHLTEYNSCIYSWYIQSSYNLIQYQTKMRTRSLTRKQNQKNLALSKNIQTTSLYLNCKRSEWVTPTEIPLYCFDPHQQNGVPENGTYVKSQEKIKSTTFLWNNPKNGPRQVIAKIIVEKNGDETLFTFQSSENFVWYEVVGNYGFANSTEKWFRLNKVDQGFDKHIKLGQFQGRIYKHNRIYHAIEQDESIQENNQPLMAEQKICRICFGGEENEENPFMNPCLCKGSIANVHTNCYKQWQNHQTSKYLGAAISTYHRMKYICQICNEYLPLFQKVANEPLMFLQYYQRIWGEQELKEIDIKIHPDENAPILIGFNQNCEINMNYGGIQDIHAQIILKNNQFMIRDRNSKFGTLIQATQPITLKKNETIRLSFRNLYYQMRVEEEIQTHTMEIQ